MSGAYYNEFDPKAAAWLRELIKAGHIAPGDVDERSITEVKPHEIRHYTQHHFFAGIGGWSLALRLAAFPDSRRVATASLPCQPFSAAGQQEGASDDRHLWPVFSDLARECGFELMFGEQVAQAIGFNWLDGVSADLEAAGYCVGSIVLGAHSVGAPHRRQRLYWVAYAPSGNASAERKQRCGQYGLQPQDGALGVGLADTKCTGLEGLTGDGRDGHEPGRLGTGETGSASTSCGVGGMEHPEGDGREQRWSESSGRGAASGCGDGAKSMGYTTCNNERRDTLPGSHGEGVATRGSSSNGTGGMGDSESVGLSGRTDDEDGGRRKLPSGPSSPWSNFDIIPCRDGKARRIESGTFPLAHGVPGRVGLLRGYGNAIVPQVAAEFIQASLDSLSL